MAFKGRQQCGLHPEFLEQQFLDGVHSAYKGAVRSGQCIHSQLVHNGTTVACADDNLYKLWLNYEQESYYRLETKATMQGYV